ncbi:type II toxin-antitoxin system RelB/DinJ family antitoxin [Candidatus Magnetaquicoccus inordinatus]|uniref:type II toxin-antitoxin system RelB/DinJ family antitoxin n=1 Tax=Candidatus Magnetaquicoccus inordinatus TaxID=2496818 RepID=UPI00102CC9C5|nr:type II toxin-antitoxin system RelB/DinJ family antitoxin [Candidatus Magnetaquicoccus inordinatus]
MSKSEMIRARIEPAIKQDAEAILSELGLSVTEAITMFYRQVVLHRGLPFLVRLPNETTQSAMMDALNGHDVTEWADLESLKKAHQ